MAKISNKMKIKNADGTFEDIQISYIGPNGTCAEGKGTVASGEYSHAEGHKTLAFGEASHAEGWNTTVSGFYSHAEGLGTIASGFSSHVQGKNNLIDQNNNYAHIVGNGNSYEERSNAHTLDWDGNAWFAGDIKLGGTGQDDSLAISLLDKIAILEFKIQQLENQLNIV